MAEQLLNTNHEQHGIQQMDPEHLLPTAQEATPLQPGEQLARTSEQLAAARGEIQHSAAETNPIKQLEAQEAAEKADQAATPRVLSRQLKDITLQQEITAIQRRLPKSQRVLSRLIHQPTVRVVSEAAAKTVSRPSGLLGGGLVAFLGTSSYLYLAKHLGFAYNYGVFLVLFASGFVIGLVLEMVVHLSLTARRRQLD